MSFEEFSVGDIHREAPIEVATTYVIDSLGNVVLWFDAVTAGIETPTLQYEIRQLTEEINIFVVKLPIDLTGWISEPVDFEEHIQEWLAEQAKEGELGADDESGGAVG